MKRWNTMKLNEFEKFLIQSNKELLNKIEEYSDNSEMWWENYNEEKGKREALEEKYKALEAEYNKVLASLTPDLEGDGF